MCLASGNRVRGGFGFLGPRTAFRYRRRFAPRASPVSHSAICPTDHAPTPAHVSAGIAIQSLNLHAPSLDDVFLAKTGRSLEGAEEAEAETEDAAAEGAPA